MKKQTGSTHETTLEVPYELKEEVHERCMWVLLCSVPYRTRSMVPAVDIYLGTYIGRLSRAARYLGRLDGIYGTLDLSLCGCSLLSISFYTLIPSLPHSLRWCMLSRNVGIRRVIELAHHSIQCEPWICACTMYACFLLPAQCIPQ